MDQASFSLDSLPSSDSTCPYCGKTHQSVSHGYIYKQISIDHREVVGKRILCSRRHGRNGCGRTRQWYLADIVPQRQYRLSVFVAFICALLGGDAVEPAYLNAIGSNAQPRHAWRWLQSFQKQLPYWRSHSSPDSEVSAFTQRTAKLSILLPTLKALSNKLGKLTDWQIKFQQKLC